ncbi:MAG TPA: PTS system mannose/fructose/sorbose family transporter subunit IID [Candidatus Eisenbacteria bacterium]
MAALRGRDLWHMGCRASLLQATFNYERQQGIGWAWALEPALARLLPDPALRRERLAEHTAYFNTQPTLASLALGAVASLEERRAAGVGPDAEGIARVKSVLGASAAALGDPLFWFTLRPFAACVGVLLAPAGLAWGALALWLCYNIVHLGLRVRGVGWGYRLGPAVLGEPLRSRLTRLTRLLGVLGAALSGVIVASMIAPGGVPRPVVFQASLIAGLGVGLVGARRGRPTPTEWALGVGALCLASTLLR